MEREHVNKDSSLQPELREIKLDFLNKDDEVILNDTIREAEEKAESEKRVPQIQGRWLSRRKKEKRNAHN